MAGISGSGRAGLLGVSPSTVYALCAAGYLSYVRTTANSIRVRPVDLDAFVAARRVGNRRLAEGAPAPAMARRTTPD